LGLLENELESAGKKVQEVFWVRIVENGVEMVGIESDDRIVVFVGVTGRMIKAIQIEFWFHKFGK
jgi:hypothetical protein